MSLCNIKLFISKCRKRLGFEAFKCILDELTPVATHQNMLSRYKIRWQWCHSIIRRFLLTVLYKMSLSPGSDSSLRFLSHCKNGSPLSIISIAWSASVVKRQAQRRFKGSTNDYSSAYPSSNSSDRYSEGILYCQRKVAYKLRVCRQCCRNFPLGFLEKCRPFSDEQEFGAGKRWELRNLFTKDCLWTVILSGNVLDVFEQILLYALINEFIFCYFATHKFAKLFYPVPHS